MLKLGSVGADVRYLQNLLKARGDTLTADGWFGQATHVALTRAQRALGLVVDGIAGPKTLAALESGNKASKLLGLADLARAAQQLDVPLAAVRAINEVESRGAGFLADGRPKILFERHIFKKRLIAKGIDTSKIPSGICSSTPGGYLGGADEHERLDTAAKYDRDCALESASWGSFQVMGYHWKALGYPTLQAFINDQYKAAGQLDTFVRFIKADPRLVKALKAKDWTSFASIYNGPAYAKSAYHTKMASAYKQFGGV